MKYIINRMNLNDNLLICNKDPDSDLIVYKYAPNPEVELYNYRSVITSNGKVVCFSPPKSIKGKVLPFAKDVVRVEEYIEGTMVNVFWSENENKWKFASRSKINANCFFFDTNGYFSDMVNETFAACNLDLNALIKDLCYSFVMQHPNNRIVTKFETHQLYLIAAYKIDDDGINDEINVYSIDSIQSDQAWETTTVKFPQPIIFKEKESVQAPYSVMGFIFKDVDGNRYKLRNSAYEYIRQLRGNQPKLLYRYFELRKSGQTSEYLKYYPEHAEKFSQFRKKLHSYTNALYNLYVNVHILKKDDPLRSDTRFKKSLNKLHEMYITQRVKINIPRVIAYVNSLPEAVLMTIV